MSPRGIWNAKNTAGCFVRDRKIVPLRNILLVTEDGFRDETLHKSDWLLGHFAAPLPAKCRNSACLILGGQSTSPDHHS